MKFNTNGVDLHTQKINDNVLKTLKYNAESTEFYFKTIEIIGALEVNPYFSGVSHLDAFEWLRALCPERIQFIKDKIDKENKSTFINKANKEDSFKIKTLKTKLVFNFIRDNPGICHHYVQDNFSDFCISPIIDQLKKENKIFEPEECIYTTVNSNMVPITENKK